MTLEAEVLARIHRKDRQTVRELTGPASYPATLTAVHALVDVGCVTYTNRIVALSRPQT